MSHRLLIVGGAGYLGSALTDILADSHHDFMVYDNLTFDDSFRKPVPFANGDVRDRDKLLPWIKWADAVIWLAGIVGEPACREHPELATDINLDAVQFLAEHYDGRIVFTSTCSVYGAQDDLLDESAPTGPLGHYAEKKLEAERFLASKNAIIFRLGTLFGLGDEYSRIRLDIVLNTLTAKAHQDGRIAVFGGTQYRPLLHVQDAAWQLYEAAIGKDVGIYNLHAANVTIAELAFAVQQHYPGLVVEHSELAKEDSRNYRVSSKKARDKLGFRPVMSIDDGIRELKALLESGRIKNINDSRYSNQKWLASRTSR
jgi:nucleoside-diphosphate-sugar epimerase